MATASPSSNPSLLTRPGEIKDRIYFYSDDTGGRAESVTWCIAQGACDRSNIINTIGPLDLEGAIDNVYGSSVSTTATAARWTRPVQLSNSLNFVHAKWTPGSISTFATSSRCMDGTMQPKERVSVHECLQDTSHVRTREGLIRCLKPVCRIIFDVDVTGGRGTTHTHAHFDDVRFHIMVATAAYVAAFHPHKDKNVVDSFKSYAWKSRGARGGYRVSVCGDFMFFNRHDMNKCATFVKCVVDHVQDRFSIDTSIYGQGRTLRVPYSHKLVHGSFTGQLLPLEDEDDAAMQCLFHTAPSTFAFDAPYLQGRCCTSYSSTYLHWLAVRWGDDPDAVHAAAYTYMLAARNRATVDGAVLGVVYTAYHRSTAHLHATHRRRVRRAAAATTDVEDAVTKHIRDLAHTMREHNPVVAKYGQYSWRTNVCSVHNTVHSRRNPGTLVRMCPRTHNIVSTCFKR